MQFKKISFNVKLFHFMSFLCYLKSNAYRFFINSVACNRRVSQRDTQEGVNICTCKHRRTCTLSIVA